MTLPKSIEDSLTRWEWSGPGLSEFLEAARFAGTKDVLQGRLVDGGHEGHDGKDLQQLELESHPKLESYLVT